jgi:flagellar basal body-associated protein FliL
MKKLQRHHQSHNLFPKKILLIILVLVLTVVLLFSGVALYVFLRGEPEKQINQEFSVTIEVFKYRKERGEKEHEISQFIFSQKILNVTKQILKYI